MMEGLGMKESVMLMSTPPLSPSSSSSKSNNSRKQESERRCMKMTQMYNQLQATVPGLFPKATKEMIVSKTIEYIKELENKKQKLEEVKESCTATNTNCSLTVSVSTNNNVAFFGIQSLPQSASITLIFEVFYNHQAQILAANISVNQGILILAITALVQNGNTIEIIKKEIMSL